MNTDKYQAYTHFFKSFLAHNPTSEQWEQSSRLLSKLDEGLTEKEATLALHYLAWRIKK
jgi:hypothetical protein